jgi:adenine-specific DNA-methyltransferase
MKMATTTWNRPLHNAQYYGTGLLQDLLPGRPFPYPKSLYAVEDALRFVVGSKPDAVVVDFFAGSGTTTHAVARLNRQDGGQRRSVLVTNNEVSAEEAETLSKLGLVPGDPEWEALGIFEYITKPRITVAMTGRRLDGSELTEDYKGFDESPQADGFDENVEFFDLSYEDRDSASLGQAFEAIAALLWMRAGHTGSRVDRLPEDASSWAVPAGAGYGILFNARDWRPFVDAVSGRPDLRHAFVVTDSESVFQEVVSELPAHVSTTMLYEDYLSAFEINTGAGDD